MMGMGMGRGTQMGTRNRIRIQVGTRMGAGRRRIYKMPAGNGNISQQLAGNIAAARHVAAPCCILIDAAPLADPDMNGFNHFWAYS